MLVTLVSRLRGKSDYRGEELDMLKQFHSAAGVHERKTGKEEWRECERGRDGGAQPGQVPERGAASTNVWGGVHARYLSTLPLCSRRKGLL